MIFGICVLRLLKGFLDPGFYMGSVLIERAQKIIHKITRTRTHMYTYLYRHPGETHRMLEAAE